VNELQLAARAFLQAVQSGRAQIVSVLQAATSEQGADLSSVRAALIVARADMAVAQSLALAALNATGTRAKQLAEAALTKVQNVGAKVAALPGQVLDAAKASVKQTIDDVEKAAERTIRIAQDAAGQLASDAETYTIIWAVGSAVFLILGRPIFSYLLGGRS